MLSHFSKLSTAAYKPLVHKKQVSSYVFTSCIHITFRIKWVYCKQGFFYFPTSASMLYVKQRGGICMLHT